MNYLKQKNLYWQKHNGRNSLKGNECALYFYLLEQCDTSDGWVEVIEVRNSVLMDVLDISHRTYQASRDRIATAGLIEFSAKNGSPFTKFCLYNAERKSFAETFAKNTKVNTKVGVKVDVKVGAKVEHLHLINIKTQTETESGSGTDASKVFLNANNKTHQAQYFHEHNQEGRNETLKMYGITPDQLGKYAESFNSHLLQNGKKHPTFQDWRKHFLSWLRIQINISNENRSGSTGQKHTTDNIADAARRILQDD